MRDNVRLQLSHTALKEAAKKEKQHLNLHVSCRGECTLYGGGILFCLHCTSEHTGKVEAWARRSATPVGHFIGSHTSCPILSCYTPQPGT